MATLPEKKHEREELQRIRMRNAMAVRPPVQHLQKMAVNRLVLGVGYVLGVLAAGLMIRAVDSLGLVDETLYYAGVACVSVNILLALWIFWKKPRSRHHAVILAIISLLVLVFGSVYYVEQFEQAPHDDAQGPLRY
ncbi:hypothetical protein HW115_04190 [Verrucomicrobiaceae bacterium N1E253]|uniref:Uncharacterized protein n=1 Tax=Oceaniferula marina TaxID=2748318 RepID=A0A851GKV4_9BACT|nr:hypothetical protein [Oceaniferula marina]NWK54794.1 hypothetical protein [Oceaniferula marina]